MIKRSIHAQKSGNVSVVNLPFSKSLHRSEHHMRHHFLRMNCCRWCRQTQFSSTTEFSNEMKLRLPYSYSVSMGVVFSFVVFCLCVSSDNIICWQTTYTGSFQIPCLGSCPPSTNWKILLISLAKYAISGQFNTETDFLPGLYEFVWTGFRLIIFIFQKSMQILFTDRALPTIKCMEKILSLSVSPYRPKITVAYAYLPTIPLSAEFLLLDCTSFCYSTRSKNILLKKKQPPPPPPKEKDFLCCEKACGWDWLTSNQLQQRKLAVGLSVWCLPRGWLCHSQSLFVF